MSKKSFLIVGNWKMNPITPQEARTIFNGVRKVAASMSRTKTVICTPFIYLYLIKESENLFAGCQDVYWEMMGAYTGQVSPEMIFNSGAKYVIIGHSERRASGESDDMVSKKMQASIRSELTPIICVGESNRDDQGAYFEFIKNQIFAAFSKFKKPDVKKSVIAYEPIWAIGKEGKAATAGDVHEMTIFIRKVLSDMYDQGTANSVKILYGGSVNAKNAEEFLKQGNCDGLLVGRDSLNPRNFGEILRIADSL